MALEHFDEADFRLVELPARGDETAVLVAVGIAQHDLLLAAAAIDQSSILRDRQQLFHDADTLLQVVDGLKQWDKMKSASPFGCDEPDLLEQQRQLQHVRNALRLGDNAGADGVVAVNPADFSGRPEDGEL